LFKGIKIITMMIDGEYTRKSAQIRILEVSIDTRKETIETGLAFLY
jgi:hypothetical protein